MRTLILVALFAAAGTPESASLARAQYQLAVRKTAELKGSARNPIRALLLALEIRDALDRAIALDPALLPARADRARFAMHAPSLLGGGASRARTEAAEIAARDPARGAFVLGYILYREKQYGGARLELQRAASGARASADRLEALQWLGWLSQETGQYETAFATFEKMITEDTAHRSALYEIGRTAAFCACRSERGVHALRQYIQSPDRSGVPSLAEAHYHLATLLERGGDTDGARRELDRAWTLDPDLSGLKEARERLRKKSNG